MQTRGTIGTMPLNFYCIVSNFLKAIIPINVFVHVPCPYIMELITKS